MNISKARLKRVSKNKGRNAAQKRELKQQLVRKHGTVCQICKRRFSFDQLTLDHIIPLTIKVDWSLSNLQLACYPCNQEKADNYIDPWSLI